MYKVKHLLLPQQETYKVKSVFGFLGKLKTMCCITACKVKHLIWFPMKWITLCFMASYKVKFGWDSREHCVLHRVGHCVLFRSVRSVLFHSLKGTLRSFPVFFEFLATYETQKNAKNATFFCKEWKRTQHSFAKNVKERENVLFFCKRTRERSVLFSIYI